MTWRQIEPEKEFYSANDDKLFQAVKTLEHIDGTSKPDGNKAHIAVVNGSYVLFISTNRKTEFKRTTEWFWEAVQALQRLPNPSLAYDWLKDGFI